MTNGIDKLPNKERIAIVAVGFNRQEALSRLLQTVANAVYDTNDVPLVISIDASGDENLYNYVKSFEWKHGDKYVNIQKERLGLKKHLFQCMSLSKYFKGVIILEDDIAVSPYFYHYANKVLDKYGDEERVAGIALYRNEFDGFSGIPFQPLPNGQDVFAWKSVCSWGELLNERMWNQFSEWLSSWDENFDAIDMNGIIKGWSRAWSKYFYAYLVSTNKYFIYPIESLSTNFNDAGGEHGGGESSVQVSLLQGKRNYQFDNIESLVRYDIYNHNEDIANWLNIDTKELTVDYYYSSRKYYGRYVLTNNKLPYDRVKGFSLSMRPWELNIKYGICGEDIILYDRGTSEPINSPKKVYSDSILLYYFGRYKNHFTIRFAIKNFLKKLKDRLGL